MNLLWLPTSHAQTNERAPRGPEQIFTELCRDSLHTRCTQDNLEGKLLPVLQKYLKRLPVDTLKMTLKFTVTPVGHRDRTEIILNFNQPGLSDKLKKKLDRALGELEPFKVMNHNPGDYPSWHRFEYVYKVLKRENTLKPLSTTEKYNRGIVLQVPRFPECPQAGDLKDRKCFQEQMQQHIKRHFQYPEAALRQGIQGTVYVMFDIDEHGQISSLRTKGPSLLLTAEASRIISLLPQFHPAREDGEPVSIPFSIPIGFKLMTTN